MTAQEDVWFEPASRCYSAASVSPCTCCEGRGCIGRPSSGQGGLRMHISRPLALSLVSHLLSSAGCGRTSRLNRRYETLREPNQFAAPVSIRGAPTRRTLHAPCACNSPSPHRLPPLKPQLLLTMNFLGLACMRIPRLSARRCRNQRCRYSCGAILRSRTHTTDCCAVGDSPTALAARRLQQAPSCAAVSPMDRPLLPCSIDTCHSLDIPG